MNPPSQSVFLITGSNRGLGLSLVRTFLSRPSTLILATCRDPSSPDASELRKLAEENPGRLNILKLLSGDEETHQGLGEEIGRRWGRVDVVIPCAAVGKNTPFFDTPVENHRRHFETNTLSLILLFNTIRPYLLPSPPPADRPSPPKFIVISSFVGSIGGAVAFLSPLSSYGMSKAAINWWIRMLHLELGKKEGLVAFPLHPGLFESDLANDGFAYVPPTSRVKMPWQPLERVTENVAKLIEESTVEKDGGVFRNYDGGVVAW